MTGLAELAKRLDELEVRVESTDRERQAAEEKREAVEKERDHYKQLYLEMMERCRKLERGLLGQKAERLPKDESQLALDMLGMMIDERAKAEIDALVAKQPVRPHTRRKPTGRKPLPEHLPTIEIELIPDIVQQEGLDAFERIGEEVSEALEKRRESFVNVRVVKPKFVRKDRDRNGPTKVYICGSPELPIPRGLAGPGLLADTLVKRWQDHLPLHRLEGIYAREGVELARSTMCGWHEQLAPLVEPLVAAMRQDAFEQPYLCTDATGVLVQAKEKCRTGHFWVLVAPGRHVLFEYTRKHNADAVDQVLAGYEGYLVADAHVVYDHLYEERSVTEVNCWAHCRRYFFKALSSEPERSREALGYIGALFKIERSLATAPRRKKEKVRAKHSAPIVERFFSWCDAQWPTLLEDTPLYGGVRYARNQRTGLVRFLDDGRLPIHNNVSELHLRRQAVGRKNWLFVGSDEGGRINALFTSLLASCRMLGVEPWSYLRDLLCLLPGWPAHRVLELAPVNWPTTRELEEVEYLLDGNPYRRATIVEREGRYERKPPPAPTP